MSLFIKYFIALVMLLSFDVMADSMMKKTPTPKSFSIVTYVAERCP